MLAQSWFDPGQVRVRRYEAAVEPGAALTWTGCAMAETLLSEEDRSTSAELMPPAMRHGHSCSNQALVPGMGVVRRLIEEARDGQRRPTREGNREHKAPGERPDQPEQSHFDGGPSRSSSG
jgi:hypothetical protein